MTTTFDPTTVTLVTSRGPLNHAQLAFYCDDADCNRIPDYMIIEGHSVQNRTATKIACYCPAHVATEHVMSREALTQLCASRDKLALPFFDAALRAWPHPVRLGV